MRVRKIYWVALCAALGITACSFGFRDQELGGGGVSWPLTATGDLIMGDNDILINQDSRICISGTNVCISSNNPANMFLSTNGTTRLHVATTHVSSLVPAFAQLNTGIAAFAGGGQASATQLNYGTQIVATVATTGDSVKLPETPFGVGGTTVRIFNDGANAMNLFPGSGDTINALAANTAISVPASDFADCTSLSGSAWRCVVLSP